jgi:hypothetical protein
MSYVAFDLDNTLGYFYHIMAVAPFLSAETLENWSYMRHNSGFKLSPSLKAKLKKAEAAYIDAVLERPHLIQILLRPNIDAMMRPILTGRQNGRVRSVVIYSNTDNAFAIRLAVRLLEARYGVRDLFCGTVDATHPIRKPDYAQIEGGEPLKTFPVLRSIFRRLCKVALPIKPHEVIFIDERPKRHALTNYEPEGLTYIQPTVYAPKLPQAHKKEIFKLLLDVLDAQGLLRDDEYMNSRIFKCMRQSYVSGNGTRRFTPIDGFHELAAHAAHEIAVAGAEAIPFKDDTVALRRAILRALAKN